MVCKDRFEQGKTWELEHKITRKTEIPSKEIVKMGRNTAEEQITSKHIN